MKCEIHQKGMYLLGTTTKDIHGGPTFGACKLSMLPTWERQKAVISKDY